MGPRESTCEPMDFCILSPLVTVLSETYTRFNSSPKIQLQKEKSL